MWLLKLCIKHDCTIGNRCARFKCSSNSISLSAWRDSKYEYTAQKHELLGSPKRVQAFLQDLKKDRRVFNMKTLGRQCYFIEKRRRKEIPSSSYNPALFFTKPVSVDTRGWESWELASREKKTLEDFLESLRSSFSIEVRGVSLKQFAAKNNLDDLNNSLSIVKRTEGELDQRLVEQLKTKHIEGDQWFRDFQDWLLIAFNNPYNYKKPNSELSLLEQNRPRIIPLIKNHLQIHYGVGVGETELELVRWQLEEQDKLDVVAIDINGVFLELFLENLKCKQTEFPHSRIRFKGFNCTFQNTSSEDFSFVNSSFKNNVHICLGGTFGNFRHQDEIWRVFQRNSKKGDRLLLAFQLNNHIEEAFEKYKLNKYYPNFVLNYSDEKIDPKKIRWTLDKSTGFISMRYKGMEVFRTRKYEAKKLARELKAFNFKLLGKWVDEYENSCVCVFEKV